tara:strand:- start:418 stop:606 length:189 start_codon:yes stop_codon:yes gene_type:complete
MENTTFTFKVGDKEYNVKAESKVNAMVWMNRNVMDKISANPFAWFDGAQSNSFYAASGNFFD